MDRNGLIFSGVLHLTVILLLILGLPSLFKKDVTDPMPISVELVDVAEMKLAKGEVKPVVNPVQKAEPVPQQQQEKQDIKPEPKPEPRPEPKPVETKEELSKIEEDILSLLDDDVLDALALEQKKPKEEPKKEEPKKEEKKEEKKKEEKKSEPKKADAKESKKKVDAFDSILKNVADRPLKEQSAMMDPNGYEDISQVLSANELDGLRRQIASCWNVPAGARNAEDLMVEVHVEIDSQAIVRVANIKGGNTSHPYYKAAADSALRALRSPKCSPLQIPPSRISDLRNFTIRFDPKMMF